MSKNIFNIGHCSWLIAKPLNCDVSILILVLKTELDKIELLYWQMKEIDYELNDKSNLPAPIFNGN